MFQRVLWISLTQAIRSVLLVLIPLSAIALIAWSTAGSAEPNTTDPIRAALWLWLGAHHIPFNLNLPPGHVAGFLSYLPIGALLFPVIAIRSSMKRIYSATDYSQEARLARTIFIILYSCFTQIAIFASRSSEVSASWLWALGIVPIGVWLSTTGITQSRRRESGLAARHARGLLAITLGTSALLYGLLLIINLKTVTDLTKVIQPGIVGGILLLLLNLLFLPNVIIAVATYFLGVGFGVGSGTLISPFIHRYDQIPALPLLGALPTGTHPLLFIGVIFFIAIGVTLYQLAYSESTRILRQSFLLTILGFALLCSGATGSLITSQMSNFGVSIWKSTLAFAIALGVGIALSAITPAAIGSLQNRRR